MERLTKRAVFAWICAALSLELWVISGSWPVALPTAAVAAVAMAVLASVNRRAVAIVLVLSYVFPVLFRSWVHGPHFAPQEAVWMAALTGAMAPDALRSSWHIPARWRPLLVTAMLVIVVVTPVVIARELDLNPGLLIDRQYWAWYGAMWPSLAVTWLVNSAVTLVIGVMWFDWLFGARDLDFGPSIVTPLAVSALALALVSAYQLFVDISFLNETVFAVLHRASGTMDDANVSGALAALWVGAGYLWARRGGSGGTWLAPAAVAIAWLAVWASGSRTAFVAAALTTACIGISIYKEGEHLRQRLKWAVVAFAAAVPVAILILSALPQENGPIRRLRYALPDSPGRIVRELWDRNGYGTVATAIIRDVPFFGIGVGTYHLIASDYSPGLAPDNAQNWLRHQLAELGIVGVAPWIVWFVLFGVYVLRPRSEDPPGAWVTRGALLSFAVISMLGMPGQDVMVVMTFWTLAYWHIRSVESADVTAPGRAPGWAWAVGTAVVIAAAAGTAWVGMGYLRPVARAQRTTLPYTYGFLAAETTGPGAGYHPTRMHGVAVLDPTSRWLSVSVKLDDRESTQPVDVRVWTEGATVLKGRLSSTSPLSAVVELPAQPKRVQIELSARRADSLLPLWLRRHDRRLLVKWEFLDQAPPRAPGYSHTFSS